MLVLIAFVAMFIQGYILGLMGCKTNSKEYWIITLTTIAYGIANLFLGRG